MSDYRPGSPAQSPCGVRPTGPTQTPAPFDPFEQAHRTCPGCGTAMQDRGCKLRCTRCGFFLDCSDG